ncbi:unnamed protein product [Gongylonema pulchrum]|uniref:Nrap_D6 domain-containing protein n=1 Tax=Gongylonema pulchrum TaxID=637853 RepID=A0A183DGC2_9BILA|nr:unnamed protein product [Gongylonema pulchrum]
MIGVVWKPAALTPRDSKISGCLHRTKGADNLLTVNVEAVLEDFAVLGHGIVRDVRRNCSTSSDENNQENGG